jgi:hypothetical protein
LIYKVLTVKAAHSLAAGSACHDWNAVHVRFGNHGCHRGVDIAINKFFGDVRIENCVKTIRFHGRRLKSWLFFF